jgi:hypothetical protein
MFPNYKLNLTQLNSSTAVTILIAAWGFFLQNPSLPQIILNTLHGRVRFVLEKVVYLTDKLVQRAVFDINARERDAMQSFCGLFSCSSTTLSFTLFFHHSFSFTFSLALFSLPIFLYYSLAASQSQL